MLITSIVMKWKKIKEQEYVMLAKISARMLFTFSLLLLKKPLVRSGKFVRSFVRMYIHNTYIHYTYIHMALQNSKKKKFVIELLHVQEI